MAKNYSHSIENGFCTVCGDTEEWLTSRNESCEYAIPAADVIAGDYLHATTEGSKRSATIAIGSVTRDGDTVTLHGAQAAYTYPAATLVTINH